MSGIRMSKKTSEILPFHQEIALPFELPAKVYGAMLAIWHLRPALQRRCPLHQGRRRDWVRFLAWCATDGRKDYAILREIPEWEEELNRPVRLPALKNDPWQGCFSLGMFFSGVTTYRWSFSALLKSKRARNRVARAFWRGRRHEIGLSTIPEWQRSALGNRFQSIQNLIQVIRLKKHDLALADSDLIEKYGLNELNVLSSHGLSPDSMLRCALLPEGIHISPIPIPLHAMRAAAPVIQLLKKNPTEKQRAAVTGLIETNFLRSGRAQYPFGVNLFGYARGELGIGEDIRQVAKALEANDVPVCIVNFEPGKNISQADRTADHWICEEPKYAFNLFCMTGIETSRYVCERGARALENRYNIGLWPWELPDWPESCRHAYAWVDEVWGISEYAARAHRHAAPRPFLPMSLPVALGEVGGQTRADFGLPENVYLYCFAFDINSSAARKNPEGLIEAFQRAFPPGGKEDVGLVLKISHPETGCKLWRTIRKAAARDPRIHIIEETMRRPELLALFNVCNCFVSLHRAEGFGRCMAEALLLGKQVVATGFSGNLDFCEPSRVALVRYRMRPLAKGDYMWGEGQEWADPDLEHAAELMQSVRVDPRDTRHRDFDFHPSLVGARYAARLRNIWSQRASQVVSAAYAAI